MDLHSPRTSVEQVPSKRQTGKAFAICMVYGCSNVCVSNKVLLLVAECISNDSSKAKKCSNSIAQE